MAKDRKTVLAIVLAVKRGFVSPEEGMKILEQAEAGDSDEAEATVFSMVPNSQQEELRADAAELADHKSEATRILEEAGVPPSVQQTLLSLGTEAEPAREDIEATLLSLAPSRATGQAETPQLNTPAERYQILREHARGGMGRILIAVDKVVGREVALKELLPFHGQSGSTPGTPMSDTSATAAARFLREATVTGQLEHPNIVPVYEIGQREDGSLYYTMKFVKGRTLATRLRAIRNDVDLTDQEKLLERLKLLDAFVDVCNAIAFSHSRGVIHRDIKPANIMLGDFGEALVLDWGLARVKGSQEVARKSDLETNAAADITLEGEVMGTPAYMPPEQAAGKLDQVDERSDVYSLGAVLFEIVCGEPPYRGKTAKQVLSSVLSEQPRRVTDLSPDAPPELAALVTRALLRDPGQRFQSARELAEQVQAYRDGRMVSAYTYSAVELVKRFVAKNRAAVSVTVLALLLLIAGGGYAYSKVMAERDSALAAEAEALKQSQIAEKQAAEAKRQKGIAEGEATEAERQRGIAEAETAEAERQKGIALANAQAAKDARDDAKQKADEAERQRKIADENALRAKKSADEAELAGRNAKSALALAQENLAQAHQGYSRLAEERDQPGEALVHLAAAHAADKQVVSVERLVSTLNRTVFPVWQTRSYVDLPADVASFTADCRLCAAPLRRAPRILDDFENTADNVDLPDIGIWDVASGTLLRRIETEDYLRRRLLLSADGTRLAALDSAGKLTLWDVATGNELASRPIFDWGGKPLIASGPTGETFFTASPGGVLSEWNFSDGTPGRKLKSDSRPDALAVSKDGTRIAISTVTGMALQWEMGSDKPPLRRSLGEGSSVVGYGPDGLLVSHISDVFFTDTAEIQLWDFKLEKLLRTFATRASQVSSLSTNQAGTYMAVGLYTGGWKLYDYQSGSITQQRGKSGGNVVAVRFAPDGKSLVLAQKGEGFDVLKIGGEPLVARSPEHSLGSMSLEFSPDGRYFASAGFDGRLLLRNSTDGSSVWALNISDSQLLRLTFSPDGKTIAVYSANQVISFVDVAGGRSIQSIQLNIYPYGMKFSPDGRYLAAPTRDGPIHWIDPDTAEVAKTLTLSNGAPVISVVFAPNVNRVWFVDNTLNGWQWDWEERDFAQPIGQIRYEGIQHIFNSTISPDGDVIVMSLSDGSIVGWNPSPFSQRFNCQCGEGPIVNSAFGTSSGFVVCGTGDGMLCFVDVTRGVVVKKQRAHRAGIVGVAVSPDGRSIITSAVDGEFRAWDAPPIMYPRVHRVGATSAEHPCLSPDGSMIAANVDTGLVRILQADTGELLDEVAVPDAYVTDLCFAPDSKSLAITVSSGRLLVYDLESKDIRSIRLFDWPGSVDFDEQGRLLVVGHYYGLQIRNFDSGELLFSVPDTAEFINVRALPGGKSVLLTGMDHEPRIVNVETGETIAALERGGYGSGASSVSPDGGTLAIVRDVGLIVFHKVADGARLRSVKLRNKTIKSLHFLPDGNRLFYVTTDGIGVVIDVHTGQELLTTWFSYFYIVGGLLSPDGSSAFVVESYGRMERWHLAPLLSQLLSLAELEVEQLTAMAQILSGMKLDKLDAISLPRRTGKISWLTPDAKPPGFLDGPMPSWVPKLEGATIEQAQTFLGAMREKRLARIRQYERQWADAFEGYRYKEELGSDLTVETLTIPPREKDESGEYIGEPEGEVDFQAWLADRRSDTATALQERIAVYLGREQSALEGGNWKLARVWCNQLSNLEPDNPAWIIESSRLALRINDSWMATWQLETNLHRATPEQRPVMLLLWARMMASEWSLQDMVRRFDAARDAGYLADDWHLYRAEALERYGAYEEAVTAAQRGIAESADQNVVASLSFLHARCIGWIRMRAESDDLPKVCVTSVPEGSVAASAGLQVGDVILGFKASDEERFNAYAWDAESILADWQTFLDTAPAALTSASIRLMRDGVEVEIDYPRSDFDAELFTLKEKGN